MKKIEKKKLEKYTNQFKLLMLMIILILTIVFVMSNIPKRSVSYATTTGATDIQLMARAINGEARGEPYEGQVAIRSSYFKQSKKFTISKYNSRSNISIRSIYSSI